MSETLKAGAELIKSIAPLGIVALAIVAIVLLVFWPSPKNNKALWAAMVLIPILAAFDRLVPSPKVEEAKPTIVAKIPAPTGEVLWTATGLQADWTERDWAFTAGGSPKYVVTPIGSKSVEVLCDHNRVGSVAVCWDNRPTGYVRTIKVTDIDLNSSPPQWCTYKDKGVKLSTSPNGSAPGNVFICAKTVEK